MIDDASIHDSISKILLSFILKNLHIRNFRENQYDVIFQAIKAYESGKKHVIVSAPVGFGKSVVSYALAMYFNSAYFLTVQKMLQDQYNHDFAMPSVMARKNYACKMFPSCNCSQCMFDAMPTQKHACECPFRTAYKKFIESKVSVTNYAYALANIGTINSSVTRGICVCDEAHKLPDELLARGVVDINYEKEQHICKNIGYSYDFSKFLRTDANDYATLFYCLIHDFAEWCEECSSRLAIRIAQQSKMIRSTQNVNQLKQLQYAYQHYNEHIAHINTLCNHGVDNKTCFEDVFMITKTMSGIKFKPYDSAPFFKRIMNHRFSDRFLFMSGTILSPTYFYNDLGLDSSECEYIAVDSNFDVKHRQIYVDPVGSLSYNHKTATYPLLTHKIDALLSKYNNVKGIIHCHNYEIQSIIVTNLSKSAQRNRLLIVNSENKREMLDKFKVSDEPLVLVSPSLSEGLDLKDDLSRFCIICKVPYLSLADDWTVKKIKFDNKWKGRWYAIKTAETLIQQTGRSVRSKDDYADTYILDSDFVHFYNQNLDLFPDWWKQAVIMR